MKYLKMLGLAAVAAMALTAFTVGSASATTLEVGGVAKKEEAVKLDASLKSGNSAVLSRTDGSLANTCTTSTVAGETEKDEGGDYSGPSVTGAIKTLTFTNCERTVDVHKPGVLHVERIGATTNGTVSSSGAEVTVNTPFGTVNCKTGSGTDLGTLTGVASGQAEMHISAVLNCGILLPSASWKGTYVVTSPSGLGVTA